MYFLPIFAFHLTLAILLTTDSSRCYFMNDRNDDDGEHMERHASFLLWGASPPYPPFFARADRVGLIDLGGRGATRKTRLVWEGRPWEVFGKGGSEGADAAGSAQ